MHNTRLAQAHGTLLEQKLLCLTSGIKLRVERIHNDQAVTVGLSLVAKVVDVPKKKDGTTQEMSLTVNTKVFIKLPSQDDTDPEPARQLEDVRRRFRMEFQKHDLINYVAQRAEEDQAPQIGGKTYRFTVPRLLHSSEILSIENTLNPTDKELTDVYKFFPVLIYEFISFTQGEALPPCENVNDWLGFALSLVAVVRRLHNQGIIHSSIVPRHILKLESKGSEERYALVGFGYAALCVHPPEKAAAIPADIQYRAPEVFENGGHLVAGAPETLSFATDIFSIGAILFAMILEARRGTNGSAEPAHSGAETPDPKKGGSQTMLETLRPFYEVQAREKTRFPVYRDQIKRKAELKHRVYELAMQHNSRLIEDNENIVKVLDGCLSFDPAERFSCAEDLDEAIRGLVLGSLPEAQLTAEPAIPCHAAAAESKPEDLPPNIQAEAGLFRVFVRKAHADYMNLREHVRRRHLEIFGSRDVIVNSLCKAVSSLITGTETTRVYRTLTMPSYWTDDNLGSNGRFLTMNKHAARMGVRIERVFLVSGPFYTLNQSERRVLEYQLAAINSLQAGEKTGQPLDVRVVTLARSDLVEFERRGTTVAVLAREVFPKAEHWDESLKKKMIGKFLSANFVSRAVISRQGGRDTISRRIQKVRYWDPYAAPIYHARFVEACQQFDAYFHHQSQTLAAYVRGTRGQRLEDVLKLADERLYRPHSQ